MKLTLSQALSQALNWPWSFQAHCFSTFVVALLASKAIRVIAYIGLASTSKIILYLPSCLVLDFLSICFVRILLWQNKGRLGVSCCVLAGFLTLVTAGGASSRMAFYIQSGAEIDWADAGAFATNKNALMVLLSGKWELIGSFSSIMVTSFFLQAPLFRAMGNFLCSVAVPCMAAQRFVANRWNPTAQTKYTALNRADLDDDSSFEMENDSMRSSEDSASRNANRGPYWALLVALKELSIYWFIAFMFFTLLIRPSRPYNHMTRTLPEEMLDAFRPEASYCDVQREIFNNKWPYPKLLDEANWKEPSGNFQGWAPGNKELNDKYRSNTLDWMPSSGLGGFERWSEKRRQQDAEFLAEQKEGEHRRCSGVKWRSMSYNPIEDPMKISNLDTEILEPIKEAFDNGTVKIKNVVYILMESLRAELFPLQQGSDFHKMILELSPESERAKINEKLSRLTPHIEKITGVSGGFTDEEGNPYPRDTPKWTDKIPEENGGVNVIGSMTAATMSTKSLMVNHCGVWAMPVEKFDEADTAPYQPCAPQILHAFNQANKSREADDYRNRPWRSQLFESMIEIYDRQPDFDRKINFTDAFTKEDIDAHPDTDKSDPMYEKINYFSYPEPVLKPHIKKYIKDAVDNNERIWMSHFTSTTHHEWRTPKWFPTEDYMPSDSNLNHRNFNRYLNTIRFHDQWMGELMQMFEDLGIADETLIVFAGDHGMAFREDNGIQGTYSNTHISNFRVPISIRHPHLPRVQYQANATTVSSLPTILDLLISSGSLNEEDTAIASGLVGEYEGQSLIRPYRTNENGRRAWNFGVVNSGGKMLVVTSADTKFKLSSPRMKDFPYKFVDLEKDPMEQNPIVRWTVGELAHAAGMECGEEARVWVEEAEKVGLWWGQERKRLWQWRLRDHDQL